MKVIVVYDDGEVFETITPEEVKKEMVDDIKELMTTDNHREFTQDEIYDEMENWVLSSMKTARRNENARTS